MKKYLVCQEDFDHKSKLQCIRMKDKLIVRSISDGKQKYSPLSDP